MKVEIIEEKTFKPFVLQLSVESERECQILVSLFGSAWGNIAELLNRRSVEAAKPFDYTEVAKIFTTEAYDLLVSKSKNKI